MNLIVSWLVSSGAKCSTPPDGTTTSRGPAGLVISTWVGWAAMPGVAAVRSISLVSLFSAPIRGEAGFRAGRDPAGGGAAVEQVLRAEHRQRAERRAGRDGQLRL